MIKERLCSVAPALSHSHHALAVTAKYRPIIMALLKPGNINLTFTLLKRHTDAGQELYLA